MRKSAILDDSSEVCGSQVSDMRIWTVMQFICIQSRSFHVRTPPATKIVPPKLPSSKVLTSVQHLCILDEKEKKAGTRKQRKLERELKAAERKTIAEEKKK